MGGRQWILILMLETISIAHACLSAPYLGRDAPGGAVWLALPEVPEQQQECQQQQQQHLAAALTASPLAEVPAALANCTLVQIRPASAVPLNTNQRPYC